MLYHDQGPKMKVGTSTLPGHLNVLIIFVKLNVLQKPLQEELRSNN